VSPFLLRRLSDESLGGRLASGEAVAFDELYRRYSHRLAAYGSHLLGDAASGDDVAQATLLKAYGALRDGRVPERVRPWLYRIAHNVAIDLVARRRDLPTSDLPDRAREAPPYAGALVAALSWLPDRQRRVYVLREIHGLRIDETAREVGLTAQQVEQALFAARNRLAELLVFGERLSCVSVQRLASGPLDFDERRALKTHLRSCPACRSALGGRAKALTLIPLSPLEWLRGLASIGGAAPAAAKVGVAVATATIATGASAPLATHELRQRPPDAHARPLPVVAPTPEPTPVAVPRRVATHPAVVAPVARVAPVAIARSTSTHEREVEHGPGGRSDDSGERGRSGEDVVAAPPAVVAPQPDERGGSIAADDVDQVDSSGPSGHAEEAEGELDD
jgi:RNA polymerase sigma factor (sigma-70 family)